MNVFGLSIARVFMGAKNSCRSLACYECRSDPELKPCNITDQDNMNMAMKTVLGQISAYGEYPKDLIKTIKYRFLFEFYDS